MWEIACSRWTSMFFHDLLINFPKDLSLLKLLYCLAFSWNMWDLSSKQPLKFSFWFKHRRTLLVYIPIPLYLYLSFSQSIMIFLNTLENASFYYSKKMSPILFVFRNGYSIVTVIETFTTSVKSVLLHIRQVIVCFTRNFFQCGISYYN